MWRYLVCVGLVKLGVDAGLLSENYELNATVGGYAVMNCHLDFPFGNEIPYQLEWDKDGENIFSWYSTDLLPPHYADTYGGRIQHLRDGSFGFGRGSINLTSIRETDNGLYHCMVSFPNRTPSTRNNGTFYYLEVEGGNLLVTPPMNFTCLEGERAEFECRTKNMESYVRWYKDGEPVADLLDLAYRAVQADNGSLIIEHTEITDPGQYECQVESPDGELQSASGFLDVQYKAKVVYAPKERYLLYGKPASLDCHFSANPPLTNLRWEKDGFLFEPSNVPGVYYSRNGSLLFNEVDDSHEGLYSCTPYNSLGSEGPSPPVRVHVQHPPKFINKPPSLYVVRLGQNAYFPCIATDGKDDYAPTIFWSRKDGAPLPENRIVLEGIGSMWIENITEDDRGVYICTARNEAANSTIEVELMLESIQPRPPYDITAVPSHNSIHIRWIAGYKGTNNIDFTVWYKQKDVGDWKTMKILTQGLTEATLVDLEPGKEYEIRILAKDLIGDGLYSEPIIVRTLEKEQQLPSYADSEVLFEDPPDDLTARAIDEGVLVTWDAGKPPRRCVLHWYKQPETQLQGVKQNMTINYLLLTDLEEEQLYLVTVSCGRSEARVTVRIPAYSRLRTAAAVAGGVAILLAILAALLYFGREKVSCKRHSSDKGRRR